MALIVHIFAQGSPFRIFLPSVIVIVLILIGTGIIDSVQAALVVGLLGVMEVALSFDNAIVNAATLQKMNEFWQRLFMTLGVLIAVAGMRLALPVVIVAFTAHLSLGQVIGLALHHPNVYSQHLDHAHPAIAAFGGVFLLLIFLDFIFEEREVQWIGPFERALCKIGKLDQLSVAIALLTLFAVSVAFGDGHQAQILIAGVLGITSYIGVNMMDTYIENKSAATAVKLGLVGFIYLELIDASFSFDGVISAFAITQKVLLIAAGLGIGAMTVRCLTVYLVRSRALQQYVYLEHGAYYAIGFLAICLMLSEKYHISEGITGGTAAALIAMALYTSKRHGAIETFSLDEEDSEPALPAKLSALPDTEPRTAFTA